MIKVNDKVATLKSIDRVCGSIGKGAEGVVQESGGDDTWWVKFLGRARTIRVRSDEIMVLDRNQIIGKIRTEQFAFNSKAGGTRFASIKDDKILGAPDVRLSNAVTADIIKSWEDYEIGIRYIAKLNPEDFKLIEQQAGKNEIYIGQFDDGVEVLEAE